MHSRVPGRKRKLASRPPAATAFGIPANSRDIIDAAFRRADLGNYAEYRLNGGCGYAV